MAGDHQVIENATGFVQEQGVALLAGPQAGDVTGDQGLERRSRLGAMQAELTHVRDVEQGGTLAALSMFGHDAARIVHGQFVAGERHHAGAKTPMQRVQRGGAQLVGSRVLEVVGVEF